MTRLRYTLALLAVAGGLVALTALLKEATCSCGSSVLPYGAIALWSGVPAIVSLAAYLAVAVALRGDDAQ
jgi:hypothetical protein